MHQAHHLTRRKFLHTSAALGSAWALAPARAEQGEHAGQWLVGTSSAEITPPLEVGILMSSGRQAWEPFEGVRLPLHAKALVVEKNQRRIALVTLDLIGLAGEAVGGMRAFREQVVAAAGGAVEADDLVLASSHTHSGPESLALSDLYHAEAFQKWSRDLARGIGSAVQSAAGAQRPARLMVASGSAPELAVNRRIETTRGIASVRRELPPDVVIGPEGPIDDRVGVAAFMDRSNRPVAILVNFTSHPVLEMCIKQVSPDYPGEMCLELEKRHPGAMAFFLQGACGNINPPTMERSAANARQFGRRLAAVADEALAGLQPVEGDQLALRWATLRLPARSVTGEPEAEPFETRIGAARIGDLALVFLPGEPFVEIALAIREASPWDFTAVVGYADDYIGYIPTDRAFRNGGYEIGPGRWSRLATGSEPIVREEAIKLLRSLGENMEAEQKSRGAETSIVLPGPLLPKRFR
ncbi:MAG: neutral/alkaline non-lysosomal ceramidase N-terminal domain-containing protein [Planctomycetota bacterium]